MLLCSNIYENKEKKYIAKINASSRFRGYCIIHVGLGQSQKNDRKFCKDGFQTISQKVYI